MPARILLVDDSPTILNLLSMVLKQYGYEVVAAKDGLEALQKLQQRDIQLVITDVNMPRMDGFTLIATMRSRKELMNLPVIVLSTESGSQDVQAGLGRGANLYLVKPVSPAELVANVRALLS
ncbi:MAG: response regulator [Pseudomonadota bacterium]